MGVSFGHPTFDRLRLMVLAREAIEEQIRLLECECWAEGVDRYALAGVLGMSRSRLYRRHGGVRSGQGPPQAVTCDAEAKRRRP